MDSGQEGSEGDGGGYLDTQGSGAMGVLMLRVSRRLVWPLTLMVSYLGIGEGEGGGGGG